MGTMTLEQVVRVIDDEIAALPTMAAMAASGIATSCDPRPAIERLYAARDAIEAIRGEPVYQWQMRDAARYRWLCSDPGTAADLFFDIDFEGVPDEEIDARIDAAIAQDQS